MIRAFRLHLPIAIILLGIADLSVMTAAVITGLSSSYAELSRVLASDSPFLWQIALFVAVNGSLLFMLGAYRKQSLISLKSITAIVIISLFLGFALLTMCFYVLPFTRIWLSALIPSYGMSLVGILSVHFIFDRLVAMRVLTRRVLVLGAGSPARRLADKIDGKAFPMLRCVGFVPIPGESVEIPETLLINREKPLAEIAADANAEEVVVALAERRRLLPTEMLLDCRLQGIQITNLSTFLEREEGRIDLDALHPSWMIFADGFSAARRVHKGAKRIFDVLVSLLTLAFSLPILAIAAIAIVIEDFGPVFYRQRRVGLHGRTFNLLKFRSMHVHAESDGVPRWSNGDDARVTRVGGLLRRTRIDELPQLYNVLRGEMSFIGPRPERPEFVALLTGEIPFYAYRHTVKPGISGWAQLNYPYGASIADAVEKLKYDLFYIKNYSLIFDLLVLLQTIRVVIWPHSAHSVSVPAFVRDEVTSATAEEPYTAS